MDLTEEQEGFAFRCSSKTRLQNTAFSRENQRRQLLYISNRFSELLLIWVIRLLQSFSLPPRGWGPIIEMQRALIERNRRLHRRMSYCIHRPDHLCSIRDSTLRE